MVHRNDPPELRSINHLLDAAQYITLYAVRIAQQTAKDDLAYEMLLSSALSLTIGLALSGTDINNLIESALTRAEYAGSPGSLPGT